MFHIPGVTPGKNIWSYNPNEPPNMDSTFHSNRSNELPGPSTSTPPTLFWGQQAAPAQYQRVDTPHHSNRSNELPGPSTSTPPPVFWPQQAAPAQYHRMDTPHHSDDSTDSGLVSSPGNHLPTYNQAAAPGSSLHHPLSHGVVTPFGASPLEAHLKYLQRLNNPRVQSDSSNESSGPSPTTPPGYVTPPQNYGSSNLERGESLKRRRSTPSSRYSDSSMDSDAVFSRERCMEYFGSRFQDTLKITDADAGQNNGEPRGVNRDQDDRGYNNGNPGIILEQQHGLYNPGHSQENPVYIPDMDDRLFFRELLQNPEMYNRMDTTVPSPPQPVPILMQDVPRQPYPLPGYLPPPVFGPGPVFSPPPPEFLPRPEFPPRRSEFTPTPAPVPVIPLERVQALPRPHDFAVYAKYPTNVQHESVTFYIEGPTLGGVIHPEAKYFGLRVSSPSGNPCLVTIRLDVEAPSRYMCCFETPECGVYIATVELWNTEEFAPKNVHESPLKIPVSRNYYGTVARTIVGPPRGRSVVREEHTRLVKVWGIDVDKFSEKIYMTDKDSNQLRMFTTEGVPITQIENNTEEMFFRPSGIAVDLPNKRIIVADKDNHRICFCTLDGELITSFGSKGHNDGQFWYPWGVAASPLGNLIAVTDTRNHRIQLFDRSGNFIRKYSVFENNPFEYKSSFDYPRGICFDNEGKYIYVSDFNIHAIFRFDTNLITKATFVPPGRVTRPQGLAVDSAGNVIVCDSRNNCCRAVTPDGALLGNIHGNGLLDAPQDVSTLPDGRLVVLDAKGAIRLF